MSLGAVAHVVDASVGIKWFLDDEDNVDLAVSLLSMFNADQARLLVPEHFRYEVANAVTTAVRVQRISAEQSRRAVEELLALDLLIVGGRGLLRAGHGAALAFGCALYDGLYLALAERANCSFIHADRRLMNSLAGRYSHELWIENFDPRAAAGQ